MASQSPFLPHSSPPPPPALGREVWNPTGCVQPPLAPARTSSLGQLPLPRHQLQSILLIAQASPCTAPHGATGQFPVTMAFCSVQGHKRQYLLLPPPHQKGHPQIGAAHRGAASHTPPHMGTSLPSALGNPLGTVEWPPPPRDTADVLVPVEQPSHAPVSHVPQPPLPPRQTQETWEALLKLRLPQGDLTFMQMALWRKLPVGDRLKNWLPHATQFPLDGHVETIVHAPISCCFLAAAFHIAVQCMGPAILGDTQETDPTELLVEQPALSLQTPLGLVY